jgi:hypothetical protein
MVKDFSSYSEEQINSLVSSIQSKKGNDLTTEEREYAEFHNFQANMQGIEEKLKSGKVLDKDEINFVENSQLPKEVKSQVAQANKQNKKTLPLSPESHENEGRFNRVRSDAKFEINHITDLHATPKEFKGRLLNELQTKGHLEFDKKGKPTGIKKNVAVALTGDIGSDFFDQSKEGLEAFLTKSIFKKAGFSKSEKKEFQTNYNFLMKLAGLSEEMITERSSSLSSQQNNPLEKFMGFIFGMQDPRFLSNEQKLEFRNTQKKVQDMLKQGMYHHARNEYGEIKNILKEFGLGPENVVMVGGNHDVHSVLEDVLGEYIVKPGETRDVSGIRFGNIVKSANGNYSPVPDYDEVF